ncbi:MAG: phosphate transport system permease protein [Hyphomicrobiaceae bacterium]|jgi:phosphate transport system permease protein
MSRKNRRTRPGVRFADSMARVAITLGGIGTIVAVSMVCLFLVWVVIPLVGHTGLEPAGSAGSGELSRPGRLAVGEYRSLAWSLSDDQVLSVFRPDTGDVLDVGPLLDGPSPTAVAMDLRGGTVVAGFADGTIRRGRVAFASSFLAASQVEESVPSADGQRVPYRKGVLERLGADQFRWDRVERSFDAPVNLDDSGSAVVAIDYAVEGGAPTVAAMTADGNLHVRRIKTRRNLFTGVETVALSGATTEIERPVGGSLPKFIRLTGLGDNVMLVWSDGQLLRYDSRKLESLDLVEQLDVIAEPGVEVSATDFLLGRKTLVVGDTRGRLAGWFRIKPTDAATSDGALMARAWSFAGRGQPVTALASSARTRMFTAGFASGEVGVYHATAERELGRAAVSAQGRAVVAVAMAPKDDGVLALAENPVNFDLNVAHPEASLATLFRRVWYEGYEGPQHVWQSTGGSDDFEPKFGLAPLVFGTLKATLYSMLFGLPLAMLAAIYTSEFLHPTVKARIKPTIELMASLPSVVLGFLAALVIAPYLENVLPQALTAIFTVPFTLLLFAHIWQLLPSPVRSRMSGRRFVMCAIAIPVGVATAAMVGPSIEAALFGGDLRGWLDGGGTGTAGGWIFLLFPGVSFLLAVGVGRSRAINRVLEVAVGRFGPASVSLLRFCVVCAASVGVTVAVATVLSSANFDPRGGFLDTYVQRNALVVGFVMGFAVIPIIYTIAEDALSTIPETLRAGSLALGATPWQTAMRIVVPTAMSGLFSAAMVGLGRAVGETMIVLMAAGNTPIMEWNLFNGFRTLSANIAVELPEAVQNSTHYRTLFLAALVLFVMTFALNTIAELIRLRFRKRAYQL